MSSTWVRPADTPEGREAAKQEFSNVFTTAISPVDIRNSTFVGGALSHVAAEVIVSYIVRRLTGAEKRSLVELAAIHALSVPLQGGMSGMLDGSHPLGLEAPMGSLMADGAKGVPAVFATTYMVNTAMSGFHMPKLSFKDILITAASKIVTRPIMAYAYPNFGASFRQGQDAVEDSFAIQRLQSTFNQPEKTDD